MKQVFETGSKKHTSEIAAVISDAAMAEMLQIYCDKSNLPNPLIQIADKPVSGLRSFPVNARIFILQSNEIITETLLDNLCALLQSNERIASVLVLNAPSQHDIRRLFKAGATDVLSYPLSENDLGVALQSAEQSSKRLAPAPVAKEGICLLYTSPSPRDQRGSRMPSSA